MMFCNFIYYLVNHCSLFTEHCVKSLSRYKCKVEAFGSLLVCQSLLTLSVNSRIFPFMDSGGWILMSMAVTCTQEISQSTRKNKWEKKKTFHFGYYKRYLSSITYICRRYERVWFPWCLLWIFIVPRELTLWLFINATVTSKYPQLLLPHFTCFLQHKPSSFLTFHQLSSGTTLRPKSHVPRG